GSVREREGFQLERHRHVHSLAASRPELGDRPSEPVARREDRVVTQVLFELPREFGVNARRFAMRDRIADHGVEIGHRPSTLTWSARGYCGRTWSALPGKDADRRGQRDLETPA